jgi:hypothetical protein
VTYWEEFNFRTVTFRSDILLCVRTNDHSQGKMRSRTDVFKCVSIPWAQPQAKDGLMLREVQSRWVKSLSVTCYTREHINTSTQCDRRVQEFCTKLSCVFTSLVSFTPFHWTGFDPDFVTATCHISRISFRVSVTSSFLLHFAVHRVFTEMRTGVNEENEIFFREKGRISVFLYTWVFWNRRPYVRYMGNRWWWHSG